VEEGVWADAPGSLASMPIGQFVINPTETVSLAYGFAAGFSTAPAVGVPSPSYSGKLDPATSGKAKISIQVNDCGLYVDKISGLAAFTIECLGTLNSTQYSRVKDKLVRKFTSCTTGSQTALDSIDGILSLQYDRPDLVLAYPAAARDIATNMAYSSKCVSAAYDSWRASFPTSGVVCPTWQPSAQQNSPEVGVAAVIAAGLPQPSEDEIPTVAAPRTELLALQKTSITYDVAFPPGSPEPSCGAPSQCAVACAGGFNGFVITTDGPDKIKVDPAYWELSNSYSQASNPFLSTGYYHAMADYGPAPGDQFGHAQRALAYKDGGGNWVGEACTYYLNGTRFWTKLLYNKNTTGAVSWCKPPI